MVKAPFPALTACVALLSLGSAGCSDNTGTGGPEVQWPPVQFRFPLVETELFAPPIGVDHDPAVYDGVEKALCTNYNGDPFPGCYDEHDGSDYLLDGDWDQMDAGSATIVAAADGVVAAGLTHIRAGAASMKPTPEALAALDALIEQ